jgi:hypothetical protein
MVVYRVRLAGKASPPIQMAKEGSMPNHRDFLYLLAKSESVGPTVSDDELARLARGFEQTKGEEPSNTGIDQQAGMRMIEAASEQAEKRQSEKKNQ